MNCEELSTTSHYLTAVAIARELAEGNVDEASAGIEELIDAMSRADRRAVRSQLARLMLHLLRWREQPEKRSISWIRSISDAREEIEGILEETPSITRAVVEGFWPAALRNALGKAEDEMGRPVVDSNLSWADVFEAEYRLNR